MVSSRPYYQVRCFVLLWTSRVLFRYHTIQRYVFGCCNTKSSQKFFEKCHVIRLNKCWNELKTSLIRKPVAGLKNRWQFWTKNFLRGLIWYAWCLWQAFLSKVIESDFFFENIAIARRAALLKRDRFFCNFF